MLGYKFQKPKIIGKKFHKIRENENPSRLKRMKSILLN